MDRQQLGLSGRHLVTSDEQRSVEQTWHRWSLGLRGHQPPEARDHRTEASPRKLDDGRLRFSIVQDDRDLREEHEVRHRHADRLGLPEIVVRLIKTLRLQEQRLSLAHQEDATRVRTTHIP